MIKKIDTPEFEPVYALDRCIDVVEGLDYLSGEVQEVSSGYPVDEHHLSILQIANRAISELREADAAKAAELTRKIRSSHIASNCTDILGLKSSSRILKEKRTKIAIFTQQIDDIFEGIFEGAEPDEKDVIRDIAQRQITKAGEDAAKAEAVYSEKQTMISGIKSILRREIQDKPTVNVPNIKKFNDAYCDTFNQDTFNQFKSIVDIIREIRSGMILEPALVQRLHPKLYASKRPSAYAKFDQLFDELANEYGGVYYAMAHALIQRGKLYQSNDAGKTIGNQLDTIYRLVVSDDHKLRSLNDVTQKISIGLLPHLVVWSSAIPKWGKKS